MIFIIDLSIFIYSRLNHSVYKTYVTVFPEPKVTSLNALFCLTDKTQQYLIHYDIKHRKSNFHIKHVTERVSSLLKGTSYNLQSAGKQLNLDTWEKKE